MGCRHVAQHLAFANTTTTCQTHKVLLLSSRSSLPGRISEPMNMFEYRFALFCCVQAGVAVRYVALGVSSDCGLLNAHVYIRAL
jgi:hypothetical protein